YRAKATGSGVPVNHTVLLNNQGNTIPLKNLQTRKIAYVSFLEQADLAVFGEILERYTVVDGFDAPSEETTYRQLDENLKFYNTLIFTVSDADLRNQRLVQFLNT